MIRPNLGEFCYTVILPSYFNGTVNIMIANEQHLFRHSYILKQEIVLSNAQLMLIASCSPFTE